MIVTSFSDKGYEQYGKQFIETFLKFWPKSETLVVYHEETKPDIEDERVEYRALFDMEEAKEFFETILRSHPIFRGKRMEGKAYDYRMDAFRFSRKVFALTDAYKNSDSQFIAWIDADVYTHSKVPEKFLQMVLVDNFVAYLGRDFMYSECGFMAFDTGKPLASEFFDLYKKSYVSGAFRYLGEWHDCYVFDYTRVLLGVSENNLSHGMQFDHPFSETVLGKYMHHLKGERKDPEKNQDHPKNKKIA